MSPFLKQYEQVISLMRTWIFKIIIKPQSLESDFSCISTRVKPNNLKEQYKKHALKIKYHDSII